MPVAAQQSPPEAGGLVEWWLARPPSVQRLPVELLSAEEAVTELARVQARKAMDAAYEAELIMVLAAARPDTDDPPPGHPGARRTGAGSPVPGTSEFLPDELALVLNCGRPFATELLSDAFQLVERMPAVHQERARGRLDPYRARVFADVLGTASDEVVAAVVPAVLPQAAGLSSGTLRRRLTAAAIAADEEFAERRRIEAERRAAVRLYPTADGMSVLSSELPAAVAAAMWSTIDQAAQLARTAGDDRPIGLLRAEAHAALVLHLGDPSRPAMTGHLTLTAPLASLHHPDRTGPADAGDPRPDPTCPACAAYAAGQAAAGAATPTLNGTPITVGHLRELLAQLDALGVQAPPGGSLALALTDDDGALLATLTPTELARLATRGCRTHSRHKSDGRRDGHDGHDGQDGGDERGDDDRGGSDGQDGGSDDGGDSDDGSAGADCACPALGPPTEAPGYAPTAAQQRFLRLRDPTCRHPGCGQPAGRTDADHVIPYDCGGRTTCQNLCCLCRSHHRLKTFARGWQFHLQPDGTLTVTTPTGITRTTRPPGLREQPALPASPPPPVDNTPPPY